MAKIVTIAELPDELAEQWLLHLRVFDRMHPDCHFRVVGRSDQATSEIVEILQGLDLGIVGVAEIKKPKLSS